MIRLKMTMIRMKMTTMRLKMTIIRLRMTMIRLKMTMIRLKITMISLKMTMMKWTSTRVPAASNSKNFGLFKDYLRPKFRKFKAQFSFKLSFRSYYISYIFKTIKTAHGHFHS